MVDICRPHHHHDLLAGGNEDSTLFRLNWSSNSTGKLLADIVVVAGLGNGNAWSVVWYAFIAPSDAGLGARYIGRR